MNNPLNEELPQHRAAWTWLVVPGAVVVQFGVVLGLLRLGLGPGAGLVSPMLFAAVLVGVGLALGVFFGQPAWAVILCTVGSGSGWFFGAGALTLLGLGGPMARAALFTSVVGGGVFGGLLGLWALDFPVPRLHTVALTCLSGLPVVAAECFGCLWGTAAAATGPAVLAAGMAGRIVIDRARLRRQTRAVLWPPGQPPPPLPDWYARPAWVGELRLEHYVLAGAFVVLQAAAMPLLLDRFWWGGMGSGLGLHKLLVSGGHWLVLGGACVTWCLLWLSMYPSRPGLQVQVWPGDTVLSLPPPPDRPPAAHQYAGWTLIAAVVLFALGVEFAAAIQKTHQPFPDDAGLVATMIILTALMAVIVLLSVSLFPAIGRLRFGLFSVLFSLAILSGLALTLFVQWTRVLRQV